MACQYFPFLDLHRTTTLLIFTFSPQTYLNTYAHDAAHLSQASATLLLTLINLPGILSCCMFGYLASDHIQHQSNPNQFHRYLSHLSLSASTNTVVSAVSSALAVFIFWGLAPTSAPNASHENSMALLALFAVTFGFFAGGYSATWGGVIKEMERDAADRNEALDSGVVYGLLNGARGLGYVGGGLLGVPLLKSGGDVSQSTGTAGYGTAYGPLIIFTGLSLVFGGWSVVWSWRNSSGRGSGGGWADMRRLTVRLVDRLLGRRR